MDILMPFSNLVRSCLIGLYLITCCSAKGGEAETLHNQRPEFTRPVDEDGNFDYAQAVNKHLEAGITPEQNVAALLYQAIGPHPRNRILSSRLFERLGISQPNEKGKHFIAFPDYQPNSGNSAEEPPSFPWKSKDAPRINSWLETNARALEIVAKAVERPKYFLPLDPQIGPDEKETGIMNSQLHGVQHSREIATALITRGMRNFRMRTPLQTWNDLFVCHMLGRHLSHGTTFTGQRVGYAIEDRAIAAELIWLSRSLCTINDLDKIEKDLQRLPRLGLISKSINVCERAAFLESVQMLRNERFDAYNGSTMDGAWNNGKLFFWSNICRGNIDRPKMAEYCNGWVDKLVNAQSQGSYRERKNAESVLKQQLRIFEVNLQGTTAGDLWDNVPDKRRENVSAFMAVQIVHMLSHALLEGFAAESRTVQRTRNLRIAMSLKKYQLLNGKYPNTLGELVPEFMDLVPHDMFSGKTPIYRQTDGGYILYSVGHNLVDDGGESFDESKDDIVVKFPL